MRWSDPHILPVGHIRTPYSTLEECPRNVDHSGPVCELVIDAAYAEGLAGLAVGDRILVLYWLDQAERGPLTQKRRGTGQTRGVFALRSPDRPNPIGAAVVTIESLAGGRVEVRGLDCLDGTPLLDIKPARTGGTGPD
jgi:tRNA-Thr(GGU) m(6)t(6)A37 methyltransferase TsaA